MIWNEKEEERISRRDGYGMKTMKKAIIRLIVLTLIVYNFVPVLGWIYPDSWHYTFLLDVWFMDIVWAFIASAVFCTKYGFKIYIPLLIFLTFVPTLFAVYGASSVIYPIVYSISSLIGCLIGALIRALIRYIKKTH